MPEPDVLDINTPVPDLGHESLRRSVVAALDGLEEQVARLERVFLLLKGTGHGMQGVLGQLLDAQAAFARNGQAVADLATRVAALESQVGDLATRVSALENPPAP